MHIQELQMKKICDKIYSKKKVVYTYFPCAKERKRKKEIKFLYFDKKKKKMKRKKKNTRCNEIF